MGTYIWSYAVDLPKLAAVWRSNSKSLVRRAIAAADVKGNAEWFADEIAEGAPTLEQAITEVAAGKLTRKKHVFQYVYAVESFAKVLGTGVGDELKVGEWIEDIYDPLARKVKGKQFDYAMGLHPDRLPVPIPKPKEEPYCSSLPPAGVKAMLVTVERMKAKSKTDEPDGDTQDTLEYVFAELDARLKGAARKRRGLVHFMY